MKTVNDLTSWKDYDLSFIKEFIDKAYQTGVDSFSYMDTEFSGNSFIARLLENDLNIYNNYQASKFERITYQKYYQRKSSSGLFAKTSSVYYVHNTIARLREDNNEDLELTVLWPIHLLNKKGVVFNLDKKTVCLMGKNLIYGIDNIIECFRQEHYNAVHAILKKELKEIFSNVEKTDMSKLSKDDISHYAVLTEIQKI